MRYSKAFAALLVVQVGLLGTVAAKSLWQRWRSPRVWVRAVAHQPDWERGRYLQLEIAVDGCHSTLDSAKQAEFPRNVDGVAQSGPYKIGAPVEVSYAADLKVEGGRLEAIRIQDPIRALRGIRVGAPAGAGCEALHLEQAVEFYLPRGVRSPLPAVDGQELWVEVALPNGGTPVAAQLAVKANRVWTPVAAQ